MIKSPLISIIIPVFKVEEYLDECVQSILSQSFTDFELLLIDDGSPDRCPKMCDAYAHKDNRIVVIHKQNGGQADARNVGINRAQGKYISFVDGDDLLADGALKILYDEMESTGADVVLGKMIRFNPDGSTRPYTRMEERKEMTGHEALKLLLEGKKLNISVCGGLYKREIWNKIRMPQGYICEDWYVTPEIYLCASNVVFRPSLWYMYRDNSNSTMGTLIKRCNPQIIDVCQHVLKIIKQSDEQLYRETLWINLKRIWKFVGIIYFRNTQKEENTFLTQVRVLLRTNFKDLFHYGLLNFFEKIGVWCFCYCEPLCFLLYKLKNLKK